MVRVPDYRLRVQRIFFAREDSHAFGQALKAHFPRVVLCSRGGIGERPVCFHKSLGERREAVYAVYLPDADWEPRFGPADSDSPWVVNPPKQQFFFRVAHDPRLLPRAARGDNERLLLQPGYVGIQYEPSDTVGRAFASRILRILTSVSTARLVHFSPSAAEIVEPGKRVTRYRAGHHAVKWCLEDDRRMMGFDCRQGAKPGDGAYRPRP